ncbi:DUF460 domain-containing protein [Candidatus Woesearchaeota archaeon]|nr:DUF460 domain-containing protein [Candidatus Woesearchaeota archaeon]
MFDLDENLIEINSQKNLSLSSLISILIKNGRPIIISCDVTPTPKFIQKLAVKTGSTIITPKYNLPIEEKRNLTKQFKEKINNTHESDSLAAALFASTQIKPLLKKISLALKKENKLDLLDNVREICIKQNIPIAEIIDILTKPKEETKIIKKVIEKRTFAEKDFLTLYNKLKKTQKEITLLKNQNEHLLQELNKKPKIQIPKQKTDQKLLFKEIAIQKLNNQLKEKQNKIGQLNSQVSELNNCFTNISNNYILKKLDNLSYQHFIFKNKVLNIQPEDILFVDNLTIHSKKTIEELKNKVKIIVYNKATKKILQALSFSFIDANKLIIKHTDLFAFVQKSQLEKELAKQDVLTKIIAEYRKQRS